MDSNCSHHMVNDVSLFTSSSKAKEYNKFVANDYVLTIKGFGEVYQNNRMMIVVCHVPFLNANIISIPQPT